MIKRALYFSLFLCSFLPSLAAQSLRLGIIGTDSSHAVEFTRLLNNASEQDHIPGATIVAAYRGGSPRLALSRDRIEKFTKQLEQNSIPFVASISDLCTRVDGLLLLSVDPELRPAEFRQAIACNKPVFVDKPFAPSLNDALQMAKLARDHHITWFSASALRYAATDLPHDAVSAEVWGPGDLGENYRLDLAWYGIHSIEALYGIFGPGVQSVARAHTAQTDVLTMIWRDGRTGTVRLIRPDEPFGAEVFQPAHPPVQKALSASYAPLVRAIVTFMQTGQPPVSAAETLETFAVMEASQRSKQKNGRQIMLPTTIVGFTKVAP